MRQKQTPDDCWAKSKSCGDYRRGSNAGGAAVCRRSSESPNLGAGTSWASAMRTFQFWRHSSYGFLLICVTFSRHRMLLFEFDCGAIGCWSGQSPSTHYQHLCPIIIKTSTPPIHHSVTGSATPEDKGTWLPIGKHARSFILHLPRARSRNNHGTSIVRPFPGCQDHHEHTARTPSPPILAFEKCDALLDIGRPEFPWFLKPRNITFDA